MSGNMGIRWGSERGDGFREFKGSKVGITRVAEISAKFLKGKTVAFYEGKMAVASHRKTNSTDTSVKIEDFIGIDVLSDFFKSEFVNWEVNLEKAIR